MKRNRLFLIVGILLLAGLAMTVWARARAQQPGDGPRPGEGDDAPVLTGSSQQEFLAMGGSLPLIYTFPGAADDGLDGASGKMATSITCTNPTGTAASVIVTVFIYNGVSYYSTGAFTISSGYTKTVSTQMTNAFFDDIALHTGEIVQGYATVRSDVPQVLCSGFLLDPTGNPPVFISELEGYR